MNKQALEGLKVIEWGSFITAPFCTLLLAQLGADVIKIERQVQGMKHATMAHFRWMNPILKKVACFSI